MLPLVTLPAKTLREPSREVTKDELSLPAIQQFSKDMIPAMYHYEGIGLAAPQVNKNVRICVIGKEADPSLKTDLVLINPCIDILSKKKNTDSEGCLSVPGTFGKVTRASHIRVTATAKDGSALDFEAKGFFARVIQHELDHLNGILFIDRAKDTYQVTAEETVEHVKRRQKDGARRPGTV